MKKRIYRTLDVKKVNFSHLEEAVKGERITVGIDVAKEIMFMTIMLPDKEVCQNLKWTHPIETRVVVNHVSSLPASQIDVVLESSSTYGDSLIYQFQQVGISVYRVGTKRSRDASEVYDGVPSSHDAKSAYIVARLHLEGASESWSQKTAKERNMAAVLSTMAMYDEHYHRNINKIEAQLARYWPEVTSHLSLTTATLLELLAKYGGPAEVACNKTSSNELMRRVGGAFLKDETILAVVDSALNTVGVPQINGEMVALQELAKETRRVQQELHKQKARIKRMSQDEVVIANMVHTLGIVTAAVVYTFGGDPNEYGNTSAYLKNLGMNLKERSSGKHKGQLKITKRGSSLVRRYLYLAVLRLIQKDKIFKAWYQRKVARSGGNKMVALVALMRKLAKAIWHMARGNRFDASLLFDCRKLKLTEGISAAG